MLAAADCVRLLGSSDNNKEFLKAREQASKILVLERARRILSLLDAYELRKDDEGALYCLLLSVCDDYVPGFNVIAAKRGRPRNKKNILGSPMLVLEVREVMAAKKLSIKRACSNISKAKTSAFYPANVATLVTRYHEQMANYDKVRNCIRCPSCDALFGKNFEHLEAVPIVTRPSRDA